MLNRVVTRRLVLVGLEMAFIGMLGWVILSSGLPGRSTQADVAGQSEEKAQKQERFAPTEGVPEPEVKRPVRSLADPGTQACSTFDFGGGAIQGFTVQPVFGTPLVLWHAVNGVCRANLAGHTTPYTFYFGQDGTCNYNTGARTASNLISPPISLAGSFAPFTLNFNYLLFVEGGGFDSTFVDISTDNGTTWTQIASKADLINDNQWHNKGLNVTTQVGAAASVRLRFRFDSVDNIANSTTGWHVDDISVCGGAFNFCVQDTVKNDFIEFNSVTGAYFTRQCSTGFTTSGIGTVTTNGSTITLTHNFNPNFNTVSVNTSTRTGTATIKKQSGLSIVAYKITDTNIDNNSCACP
ncbi:MAG: hypothetical protein AABO41_28375 [Acidobacteriota bacterium]